MPTTTTGTKRCVACGADVANTKRMKDSEGRYWCVTCGEADQQRKRQSGTKIATSGGMCASCGEATPESKLTQYGAHKLCAKCLRKKSKGPGLFSRIKGSFSGGGGSEGNKSKLIGLIVALAVLGLVAWWVNQK